MNVCVISAAVLLNHIGLHGEEMFLKFSLPVEEKIVKMKLNKTKTVTAHIEHPGFSPVNIGKNVFQ